MRDFQFSKDEVSLILKIIDHVLVHTNINREDVNTVGKIINKLSSKQIDSDAKDFYTNGEK